MSAAIEPWLREILRCPRCRAELRDDTGPDGGPELVCTAQDCGLAYRVDDGIPVLLVDEARPPAALDAQPDSQPDSHPDDARPDEVRPDDAPAAEA